MPPDQKQASSIETNLSYPNEAPDVLAVVPTFYSTNDSTLPGPALSPPPLTISSGNAYRLTTKKKTYAPVPSLTHQDNNHAFSSASYATPLPHPVHEPSFQVNQPAQFQNNSVNQHLPSSQSSNKFSLSSFFSAPLLEKITGTANSTPQGTTTAVSDVFFAESASTPAPNRGYFDSVSENASTYSSQQSHAYHTTSSLDAPLFFNPTTQQTNVPTVDQRSIPSSTLPPSGNASNYRLRGKPHYKNPLTSSQTTAPAIVPFSSVGLGHAPTVGIFNPVATEHQLQPPTSSINPSDPSQLAPTTVGIFHSSLTEDQVQPHTSTINQSVLSNQATSIAGIFNPLPTEHPVQPSNVIINPSVFSREAPPAVEIFNPIPSNHNVQPPTSNINPCVFPQETTAAARTFNPVSTNALPTAGIFDPISAEHQNQPLNSATNPTNFSLEATQTVRTFNPVSTAVQPAVGFDPILAEHQNQPLNSTTNPSSFSQEATQTVGTFNLVPAAAVPTVAIFNPVAQSTIVQPSVSSFNLNAFSPETALTVGKSNPDSTAGILKPTSAEYSVTNSSSFSQKALPIVGEFFQLASPTVGTFNPISAEHQVQPPISTINPSVLSQETPPIVSFFNQSESVPLQSSPQFNTGNLTSSFNLFEGGNVPQQLTETSQTEPQPPGKHFNQFTPPQERQPVDNPSVQNKDLVTTEYSEQSFLPSSQPVERRIEPELTPGEPKQEHNATPLQKIGSQFYTSAQGYTNLFQPFETVQESDQIQQFFQQPKQSLLPEIVQEQSEFQPQFVANPTESKPLSQETALPLHFTGVQPLDEAVNFHPSQTLGTGSADVNSPFEEENSNINPSQKTVEFLNHALTQLNDLNLNQIETSREVNFFDSDQLQKKESEKVSSTFDNFFKRQPSEQSLNITYPEPPPSTSTLASSFFTASSNSSAAEWFNSSKTIDQPVSNQFDSDVNRNRKVTLETVETAQPLAATNNQTTPPNYFQIQNFFNNPPLISATKEQDNNFNFIENNLINKRLHNLSHKASIETDGGSISSNTVEPPSSAQSDFSEFTEVNPDTVQSDEYLAGESQVLISSET